MVWLPQSMDFEWSFAGRKSSSVIAQAGRDASVLRVSDPDTPRWGSPAASCLTSQTTVVLACRPTMVVHHLKRVPGRNRAASRITGSIVNRRQHANASTAVSRCERRWRIVHWISSSLREMYCVIRNNRQLTVSVTSDVSIANHAGEWRLAFSPRSPSGDDR